MLLHTHLWTFPRAARLVKFDGHTRYAVSHGCHRICQPLEWRWYVSATAALCPLFALSLVHAGVAGEHGVGIKRLF